MNTDDDEWTMRIVDRMDRFYTRFFGELAELIDKNFLADGWQLRATMESVKAFTSTIIWPKSDKFVARAKFLGGLLGHSVAHYEAFSSHETWACVCRAFNSVIEIGERISGEASAERFDEHENPFVDERRRFLSAVEYCHRLVVRQGGIEQVVFFEAYSKALRKGSITHDARCVGGSSRIQAYQLIAAYGPLLKLHLRSVADVHRFLVKTMGVNQAGDIKRPEAICKSLQMKFRASGRPCLLERSS